jgi:proteic killer suppression protein
MIETFRGKLTEKIWNGEKTRLDSALQQKALLKLRYIHVATEITDLLVPPGNRLEALRGNRKNQYSIRVDKQYRICFKWTAAGASDVEFTDYH